MSGGAQVLAFPGGKRFSLACELTSEGAWPRRTLLRLALGPGCLAVVLRQAGPDAPWEEGLARFPADALGLPASALVRAIERAALTPGGKGFSPAGRGTTGALGLLDPRGRCLDKAIEVLLFGHGRSVAVERGSYRSEGYRQSAVVARQAEAAPVLSALGLDGSEKRVDLFGIAAGRRIPGPEAEPDGGEGPAQVRTFPLDVPRTALRAVLAPWQEALRPLLLPETIAFLDPRAWSADTAAWFLAPGRVGLYRRQAGALYPFLAPAIAGTPEVAGRVDAGRPFEEALARTVAGWLVPEEAQALTPARLRWLRGLSHEIACRDLAHLLSIVARLPLDKLPADPIGWSALLKGNHLFRLDNWGIVLGLALGDLVPADPLPQLVDADRLSWIDDMSDRLDETLVGPLLGYEPDPESTPSPAALLLLEGRDIHALERATAHWHRRLPLFEAALPTPGAESAWPALFEPVDLGEIRALALTDPGQLRAEGGHGADPDGVGGLEHCVGGYASRCYAGESHIVSIRRRTETGWERLSTAEITVQARDSGAGDVIVGVRQHRGLRNAEPPPEAEAAFGHLLDGIGRRRVPVNPAARVRRDPAGFRSGIDWGRPEAQAAAFAAWQPFLLPRYAALGVDGLRDWLGARFPPADGAGGRDAAIGG